MDVIFATIRMKYNCSSFLVYATNDLIFLNVHAQLASLDRFLVFTCNIKR